MFSYGKTTEPIQRRAVNSPRLIPAPTGADQPAPVGGGAGEDAMMDQQREQLFEQLLTALNHEDKDMTWTAEQKRREIQKQLNQTNKSSEI